MFLAAVSQYLRGPVHDRRDSKIRSIQKMVGTHLSVNLAVSGFCVEKDTYSRCGARVKWTSRGAWYLLDVQKSSIHNERAV